ncbi:MAG: putative lipid II flippase FtsW [Candidatus Curtissbacteria bacterium]
MRITSLKSSRRSVDIPFVAATVFMVLCGLVIIYDATPVTAYHDFGDKLYYFKNQLVWATLGAFALIFFSFFDYHKLLKFSHIFFAIAFILLVIVLIPGIGSKIYGARRWISVAGLSFQPSEIAKLALIFYVTAVISKFENFKIGIQDAFLVIILPALAVIGLVLIQPDLGTALILASITVTIYFVGGGPIKHLIIGAPAAIAAAAAAIVLEPYRFARLKTFLDPSHDPQGASYQINQILIALSQGGLLGVGLGGSRSKFNFIPEVQGDAIFAVFVEELGFIGAVLLIALFLFIISRGISIAQNAPDFTGKILAIGLTSLIGIQALFNLASVVALVPLTGIPLPFISYGGSSLFVTIAAVGVLINIQRQSRKV